MGKNDPDVIEIQAVINLPQIGLKAGERGMVERTEWVDNMIGRGRAALVTPPKPKKPAPADDAGDTVD